MKFFHAADIHLDSPLRGLDRYEGAPADKLRGATRRALEALVESCIAESVDFLLIAGDLYDGDWTDYNTGLFFVRQMARLREAGIRVFIVRGNHDAKSKILRLPEGVRELSTSRAETVVLDDLGVAVHGRGYARAETTEDLAQTYPAPRSDYFNIGLLHTAAEGREGHAPYAPCRVESLVQKGYDYWALGHVHQQEILHRAPWVAFSGNLQGRHARETGPKGALLVTAVDGRITEVEPRTLDVVRWCRVDVDATGAAHGYDAVDRVREALEEARERAEERPLAARVIVRGTSAAHDMLVRDPERWEAAIRAAAMDLGEIWLEAVRFCTSRSVQAADLAANDDAVGHVARGLIELAADARARRELAGEIEGLLRKLPADVRAEVRLDDEAALAELIADVEGLLLAELAGIEESE